MVQAPHPVADRTDHRRDSGLGAGFVFVGLGCLRPEVWAYENTRSLSLPILAVGAVFDILAKALSQTPHWMQLRGLEWLFRLIVEPHRFWRRYAMLNPLYCWEIVKQAIDV